MAKTFVSIFRDLVPHWLSEGAGGDVLLTICTFLDESYTKWKESLALRFPSWAQDDETLALLAQGRGLLRGGSESYGNFARRLIAWRHPRGHRIRGSAMGVVEQISAYFGNAYAEVYNGFGTKHIRRSNGTIEVTRGLWTWAITEFPFHAVIGVDSGAWNAPSKIAPDTRADIRSILYDGPNPWLAAGVMVEWVVFSPLSDQYGVDYTVSIRANYPNFSYDLDGTRMPNFPWHNLYLDVYPDRERYYVPNQEGVFSVSYSMPRDGDNAPVWRDSTALTGAWPATWPLLEGEVYTPNPNNIFTGIIQHHLPDDGDLL